MYGRVLKLSAMFVAAGLSLLAGDLSGVKTIYLLPMSGGLDQYLGGHLANDGAFQVVTDPKKADAIFSDRIGPAFEQALDDLYGPKKNQDGKLGDVDITSKPAIPPSPRGKGSLFLVDRNSHVVLWSTYALPRGAGSQDMNQLAAKIVSELDKARKAK